MTHQSVQRIESLLVPEARYNDAPLSASTTDNWVARHGGLPPMARAITRALERSGHSESEAISIAIAALKRWAAGGGNVHPSTRARAAAAVAHWEASKLAAHASRQDDIAAMEHQALAILERRFNPSQPRVAAGGPGGGEWGAAASGGGPPAGTSVQGSKFKSWSKNQIGNYPPSVKTAEQKKQWDDWFKFFSLPANQQKALGGKGKAPKQNKDVKAYLKAQQASKQGAANQASYDAMVAQARLTLSGG